MLTPEYLSTAPDRLVELYAQVEADILADMARRINGYDMFIPAAQHQLTKLEEMGGLREDIVRKLQQATGKSYAELVAIMQEAGLEALRSDNAIYAAAGLTGATGASPTMQQLLQTGLQKTGGLFDNLTRTTAATATRQFERALDRAYMQITSGAFSSSVAVQDAIKWLCAEGVQAVQYPSKTPGMPGRIDTIETAVRRATITGVNQTALAMQFARMDEMGCDLVEVSAHAGARPDHAKWQGGIYSRSGKSKKYPSLVEATGYGSGEGLGGWNCSHSFRPYFEGMPRAYSDGLLSDYSAEKYTYNGVDMTEYDALQRQREIERSVRRWKRENQVMAAEGLPATKSALKLKEWREREADFLTQTGLRPQASREYVGGWDRSSAAKASGAVRSFNTFSNSLLGVKTSSGVLVEKVSPHVFDQAKARGVTASHMTAALTSPLKEGKIRADNSQQFVGAAATVAINTDTGRVITTWPTSTRLAEKLKEAQT